MRTALLSLLLLGTAAPALAAPDGEARDERRMQREERREARAAAGGEERERPRFTRPERATEPRPERPEPMPQMARPEVERVRPAEAPAARDGDRRPQFTRRDRSAPSQTNREDSVANWRWQEREAARRDRRDRDAAPVGGERSAEAIPPVLVPRVVSPQGADRRTADRLRDRVAAEGWRQDWRRDRRYDWRRHRDRDRSRFHVGLYIDPFGWSYRPWQLGWSLPSRFYSTRYWINEPWEYRLPPVAPPYRWIRYYDDVLLVDLRTGRVVDRIPDFFW